MTAPVFVALDTVETSQASVWAEATAPHVRGVKIGLEFFYSNGIEDVLAIAGGRPLFLDLKLHDIPEHGCRRAARAPAPGTTGIH